MQRTHNVKVIPALTSLLFLILLLLPACGTDRGRSSRSVIDMTWSKGRSYEASYSRNRDRYRDLVQQVRRYDREYYERHVRTVDAEGRAVKPVDQVEFSSNQPNVPEGSVTLAGTRKKESSQDEGAVFIDANGKQVRLSDYRGKPLVLVFTRGFPGYICPMCTTYTAQITVAHRQFEEAGCQVLLVFPGQARQVDDFIDACREIAESDEELPFPVLLDPDLKAVQAFNIRADLSLPATYIFDREGIMRWGFVGEKPHERPSVEVLLREVKKL